MPIATLCPPNATPSVHKWNNFLNFMFYGKHVRGSIYTFPNSTSILILAGKFEAFWNQCLHQYISIPIKHTVYILPCWAPFAQYFICEIHPCGCMFLFLMVNELDIWCIKLPTMNSLPWPTLRSWRYSSKLSFRGFIVLNFIFRSTIDIELIFCVSYELWVISFLC